MPRPKGLPKTGGRRKGTPNHSTADARAAITLISERNVEEFEAWLDRIANGTPADNKKGLKAMPPDPERAFRVFLSLLEYCIPKLSRRKCKSARNSAGR